MSTNLVAVTSCAGILAVGLAVSLTLLALIPVLRNTCTLFSKRCTSITYQALPNGQILVKDPVTAISYWYDGNYIRSYGPFLPGTCPTSVSVDATGATTAVGSARQMCEKYDPSGFCVSVDASTSPPTALDGIPLGLAAGGSLMEPTFVLNASTLNASDQQVLCSRARSVVEASFENSPVKTEKIRIPSGQAWLDAAQIFTVLRNRAYVPPLNDPEPPVCSGHGFINPLTASCECEVGYTGSRCATRMCESDDACGNGTCNGGLCECVAGWSGDACTLRACVPCVNGQCDGSTGECVCANGFTGRACDEYVCLPACGTHGTCNTANGTCTCEPGWTGVTCSNVACPNNCSGNGVCTAPNGVCECVEGWVGLDCATAACLNNCNLRGECDLATNTCTCDAGWSGEECAIPICPNGCCEHGTCTGQTCTCDAGWSGSDCSVPDDPLTSATLCPTIATCTPVAGRYVMTYYNSESTLVSFTPPTGVDSDGYQWYASVQRDSLEIPVVEVGFKVIEAGGFMLLYGKARGRRSSVNWWSPGATADYAAPAPTPLMFHYTGTGTLTGCYTLNTITVNNAVWGDTKMTVTLERVR